MTSLRAIVVAALAAASIGLVAGCGSGGTTTASGEGGDFVAKANAICAAATDEFNALGNTQDYENLADFKDRFGKAIAIAAQQYEDIATLEPPADIARDVQAYLKQGAASVALSQGLYDRVVGGEPIADAEAATLGTKDGQATFAARRKAAAAAGLDACAA